ncbi:DUF5333 domain-containing protein [Roseobacter sp. CCS2]|uniref:DUF5333 domain-containing protein n=1 Tax=Roseobacter sp. CCS2 TaxID=391593 RepID=UPI0000F4056D|nr:DUF5333 domain-containing protein [Roseobacter sp. CCS2]EBA11481.1 hypothetical protein RCCS2_02443 [Roseobacter sp. CCS2]
MKKLALIAVLAFATVFSAGHLSAQTALKDVPKVRDGIIFVGMAYEISEQCSDIDARLFRGLNYLQSLRRHARDLGYSEAEIDAYIDDDDEKDRLEGIARAQLAQLGVVPGQEASYCTVGRAQMDANTRVGWLLR